MWAKGTERVLETSEDQANRITRKMQELFVHEIKVRGFFHAYTAHLCSLMWTPHFPEGKPKFAKKMLKKNKHKKRAALYRKHVAQEGL